MCAIGNQWLILLVHPLLSVSAVFGLQIFLNTPRQLLPRLDYVQDEIIMSCQVKEGTSLWECVHIPG